MTKEMTPSLLENRAINHLVTLYCSDPIATRRRMEDKRLNFVGQGVDIMARAFSGCAVEIQEVRHCLNGNIERHSWQFNPNPRGPLRRSLKLLEQFILNEDYKTEIANLESKLYDDMQKHILAHKRDRMETKLVCIRKLSKRTLSVSSGIDRNPAYL